MSDFCVICGKPTYDFYILRLDIWKAAGLGPEDEIHIDCLPDKLGRPLEISDFDPDAPINRILFYGYRMGRRPAEKGDAPDIPPSATPFET